MSKMGKNKVKELSRLLSKKLIALGIEKDTKSKEIGKKKALTIKDGKLEEILVPVYQRQNLHKQMIKQILGSGESAARAFLALDNQLLKGSLNPSETVSVSPPDVLPANDQ